MSERQKKKSVLEVLKQAQVSHIRHTGPMGSEGSRKSRGALWPCRCGALPPLALQRRSRSPQPRVLARGKARSCREFRVPTCSAGRVNNFTGTRLRIKWVFDWRVRCSLVQSERSFTNPSSDEFSTPTQWPGSLWSVGLICAYPHSGEDDSLIRLREQVWINLF